MIDSKWKVHGIRIVKASELDTNTAQTPGVNRAAAITHARCGSDTQPLSCVLVRSGQEPVVVNLDIPAMEKPQRVVWTDDLHQ